jgi:hypothetical protein
MCEILLQHEVVHLEDLVNVGPVNTDCHTHDHMLGVFGNAAVNAEKTGVL